MLKLLIVDDEPAMRMGLRNIIPWTEHGITIVGEADNGLTALQKAIQLEPDVILCDIRMPVKDGTTFVSELVRLMPDIRVIFITGYANEQYMMDAIRNRVCDFLIKPVTQEQVLDAVIRVRDELEEKKESDRKVYSIGSYALEKREVLVQAFWKQLLHEAMEEEKILRDLHSLDLSLPGPCYTMIALHAFPETWWQLVQKSPQAFGKFQPVMIPDHQQYTALLILNTDRVPDEEKLRAALPELEDVISGSTFMSETVRRLSEIHQLASACREYSRHSLFFPAKNTVVPAKEEFKAWDPEQLDRIEKELTDALTAGYLRRSTEALETYWEALNRIRPQNSELIRRVNHILSITSIICRLPPPEEFAEFFCTLNDIKKGYFSLMAKITNVEQAYPDIPVRRALQYLSTHFSEDLSLESVAAALCFSPSYLSKMLNEKTEYGFAGWLHYYRIRRAKELLATTDLKHYEIAEKVGYNSYKKFSEHFMQQEGQSATDYRRQFEK